MAILLIAAGVALSGCSAKSGKRASLDPFAGKGSPYYSGKGPVPWGGGRYQVGKPYEVAGHWFTPKEQPGYDKTGTASWYGEAFNRRMTSNGEWFDMTRLTAAHATLPLPSYVKVTNLENGRDVVVRVNDRGPFVGTRVIDLSKKTAEVLDFKRNGKAKVRVQYIGPAPLDDDGTHLMAMNRELNRGTSLNRMIAAAGRSKGRATAPDVQVAQAKPTRTIAPAVERIAYAALASPPPSSSAIETSFFIQLGSFGNPDNAARARDQFASVWPVQFVEFTRASGSLYRVRLGPIASQEDAQTALASAYAAGFTDARIVAAQAVQASLQ